MVKESPLPKELTLLWLDIEHWQRDNPSILSGYRPSSASYATSLRSLLYMHNESINVYSHLLGAIAFAITAPILYQRLRPLYRTASKEDVFVMGCFFIGAISCLSMSATFHLVSNHSLAVAKFGNQLDYLGIVLLIWGSFIPSLYYGFQERTELIKLYWTMITGIGIMTGYASVAPSFRTPEMRAVRAGLFVAMGLSAVFPVIHGLAVFGTNHLDKHIRLRWLITQGVLYIVGAGLYAARVPEKIWPGHFDLWFSSHQIFHFLVLAAAAIHLRGLVKAFHTKHTSNHAAIKVSSRPKRD